MISCPCKMNCYARSGVHARVQSQISHWSFGVSEKRMHDKYAIFLWAGTKVCVRGTGSSLTPYLQDEVFCSTQRSGAGAVSDLTLIVRNNLSVCMINLHLHASLTGNLSLRDELLCGSQTAFWHKRFSIFARNHGFHR